MSITEEIIDIPAEHIRNVFGEFDHYIKNIERALNVTIIARGGSLKIIGEAAKTKRAVNVLNQLIQLFFYILFSCSIFHCPISF